jgi:thiol-disulfide isomerase/thioredoxin
VPEPEGYAAMSLAQKRAHNLAWFRTPDGRAWKLASQGNPVRVSADGSFRAIDVRPGTYRLLIHLGESDATTRRLRSGVEATATAERTVVIPDGPAGEAIDLGTLELKVTARTHRTLTVGDQANEIDGATTLDGKPLRLADYRGKYVLLNFWATWGKPSLMEEPHLKASHEAFRNDVRVVMIGLNLDDDVKAAQERVEAEGLGWVQGFLGGKAREDILAAYGVWTIPRTLLIDPDGKVIAPGLRGERIRAAVAEALETR